MTRSAARLSVVATEEPPLDIGALMRAERTDPKRWARVHIEADRRAPVDLPWRKLRGWR
jgi:hypothetical protein